MNNKYHDYLVYLSNGDSNELFSGIPEKYAPVHFNDRIIFMLENQTVEIYKQNIIKIVRVEVSLDDIILSDINNLISDAWTEGMLKDGRLIDFEEWGY